MNTLNSLLQISSNYSGEEELRSLLMGTPNKEKYEPELLYVECQICNEPVLWEKGTTTALLQAANIDFRMLDASCVILADGCPHCQEGWEGYSLSVVRLASVSAEDALLLLQPKGNA